VYLKVFVENKDMRRTVRGEQAAEIAPGGKRSSDGARHFTKARDLLKFRRRLGQKDDRRKLLWSMSMFPKKFDDDFSSRASLTPTEKKKGAIERPGAMAWQHPRTGKLTGPRGKGA